MRTIFICLFLGVISAGFSRGVVAGFMVLIGLFALMYLGTLIIPASTPLSPEEIDEQKRLAEARRVEKDEKDAQRFGEIYRDSINIPKDEWRVMPSKEKAKVHTNREHMQSEFERLSTNAKTMVMSRYGYNPKTRRLF